MVQAAVGGGLIVFNDGLMMILLMAFNGILMAYDVAIMLRCGMYNSMFTLINYSYWSR